MQELARDPLWISPQQDVGLQKDSEATWPSLQTPQGLGSQPSPKLSHNPRPSPVDEGQGLWGDGAEEMVVEGDPDRAHVRCSSRHAYTLAHALFTTNCFQMWKS